MYLPPQFDAGDPQLAATLIRENPLASLISCDDQGLPFVSHLPLHLDEPSGGPFVLLGHCARANPHWRYLQSRPTAVVTFLGPHGYLSPKVYPDLQRVPSWNYVAVHATVRARLIDDPQDKDALLGKLVADHEPAFAQQWRGMAPEFAHKLLGAIVGFELRVTDLQCKVKLNQHRPESHAALQAAYAAGDGQERMLATWMQRVGIGT